MALPQTRAEPVPRLIADLSSSNRCRRAGEAQARGCKRTARPARTALSLSQLCAPLSVVQRFAKPAQKLPFTAVAVMLILGISCLRLSAISQSGWSSDVPVCCSGQRLLHEEAIVTTDARNVRPKHQAADHRPCRHRAYRRGSHGSVFISVSSEPKQNRRDCGPRGATGNQRFERVERDQEQRGPDRYWVQVLPSAISVA